MSKNLLESYRNRLSVADTYYAKSHNGQRMDSYKKLLIANALNNTSKFLNEAFESSAGTQRASLGDYKLFCLTLTTLALPNMIAPDLVLTVPMASRTGHVAYLEYVAGSTKGGVTRGDMFNSVWSLGQMTEDRMHYTGSNVVETVDGADATNPITLMWTPMIGSVKVKVNGVLLTEGTDFTVAYGTAGTKVDKRFTGNTVGSLADPNLGGVHAATDDVFGNSALDPAPNNNPAQGISPAAAGSTITLTFTTAPAAGDKVAIGYQYDNVVIPQDDIPHLSARMAEVTLEAKARRIAIYYSQIANFQAKQDYGFDLGDNLAKQAIGELQYEIDSEVVSGLRDAVRPADFTTNVWSKTPGVGVSLVEHYQGFAKVFDEAATEVYLATQKFSPNYMVCARDVITVLSFLNGWNAAPLGEINGPYFAGSYNGVKVYVSPMLAAGEWFMGVNGSDMQTSAAVYGIYMPVVPTQLLGFADGAMSQGFSTLYDFKILSKDANGYSPLLVGGKITA